MSNMSWASAKTEEAEQATTKYDADFYRNLYSQGKTARGALRPVRCALVGKENTTKTGTALSLARAGGNKGTIHIFDFDSSAENTVDYVCGDDEDVIVHRLFDELDESIFHEDNSTNWVALIDKVSWFVSMVAEDVKETEVAAIIFDGGSTFMKWCEFAMTDALLRRGVIKEEGEGFNQKEWRERNKLFKNTIQRVNALPVSRIFFTFHLKDVKSYVDLGNGSKGLMKIGEKVDWVDGTQRLFSQQIFLQRYMKEEDAAAGVKGDDSLGPNDWVVKGTIEEMKGRYTEHLGETHDVIEVRGGKVKWNGFPFLKWD